MNSSTLTPADNMNRPKAPRPHGGDAPSEEIRRVQAALVALAKSPALLKMKPNSLDCLESKVRAVMTENLFGVMEIGVLSNATHPVDIRWHGGSKLS